MNSAGNAARLYTSEILGLAVELARYPIGETHSVVADARSRSCGSTLTIGLEPTSVQTIQSFGLRVSACAIGQAAAAIFARSAEGKSLPELTGAMEAIDRWLSDEGELPNWPGISVLEAARKYPARHGAILLPWRAAIAALSKGDTHS